jgi:dynamin GTPase
MLQEMSTILRMPLDLEEELRLMAQEVRDYVEAVLNSLSANIPKVTNPGPQFLTNLP